METYFTQIKTAEDYDAVVCQTMAGYMISLRYAAQKALMMLPFLDEIEYLDIGTGTGNFAVEIAKEINLRKITLVDHSLPMLDIAKNKLSDYNKSLTIEIQPQDYHSWLNQAVIEDRKYDLITASFTLDHIKNDNKFIQVLVAIRKSLSKKGMFVLLEKSADQDNPLSSSWQSFKKMILIRKKSMLKLGIKSSEEADMFENHIMLEDYLRKPTHLMKLISQSQLTCLHLAGFKIPPVSSLNKNSYYAPSNTIETLNIEDSSIDKYAYSPLILFMRK